MDKNELKEMDKKQEIKKLSIEEFIGKALEKDSNRKNEDEILIPGYGPVTFKRPTENQSLEYLNASANAIKIDRNGTILSTDLIHMTESAKSFIYFTCPFLQDADLQEALSIKDPLDTPSKIFGQENLIDIANIIQQKFGDGMKVKRAIKN